MSAPSRDHFQAAFPASGRIVERFRARFPQSERWARRAAQLFPSGVTHDSRHLKPFPVFVQSAQGATKTTLEGHRLIDYWAGHGALLLGHSPPAVVQAVARQMERMSHPGASHTLEVEWAERVRRLIPSAERVRFTSSGTEATLMAVRLARLVTGRTKIVKFAGHFHGWHDAVMPAAEPPHPESWTVPGIPPAVAAETIIVPPNDRSAVTSALEKYRPAAVIHEGNGTRWGTVPAPPEFLRFLREATAATDTLLILDEVITGFRVAPGGYQAVCDIVPDLTTLAKVLAGGLPGGCLAGRADILQALAFENRWGRKMKHPGTFNANPVSAAAGIATLDLVQTGRPCEQANAVAAQLRRRLNALFDDLGARLVAYGQFSAVKILPEYDGPRPNSDAFVPYENDWQKLDRKFEPNFTHAFRCALLVHGVDWMGWSGTTTAAHTEDDVERTVLAFADALELLRQDGFPV